MVNLLITMLLGGLWHGANWTFVVWGAYHGVLLAVQRLIPSAGTMPALRPATTLLTFLLVCVGWVFFRAQTLGEAGTILRGLVVPTRGLELVGDGALLVVVCVLATLLGQALGQLKGSPRMLFRMPAPVAGMAMAAVLTLALMLTPGDGKAFIYFQF